jgi:cytosine/adenosine deaminase-related metal-dependent hydrolase
LDTPVLVELAAAARERGVRLHPHAAETVQEVAFTVTGSGDFAALMRSMGMDFALVGCGSGRTPVAELDAAGLLGPDSHVAHGIHVSAADRALLRTRGTVVALCPRSNARLASGEAPVAAYRAEGNVVAVGTDSLASAPSLDLLGDVAVLHALALRQGSPAEGLDRWVVEAATAGGARALGRADLGVLEPGARADLAVFAVAGPDPYAALVRDGEGSCVGTVVAGEVVPLGLPS